MKKALQWKHKFSHDVAANLKRAAEAWALNNIDQIEEQNLSCASLK